MVSSTKAGRVTKRKASRSSPRRVRLSEKGQQPLIERTNTLSIEEFISQYIDPTTEATKPATSNTASETPLEVYSAGTISERDLEACLDLVQRTSSEVYATSSAGWSRTRKRNEMKLPDMKYLIIRHDRIPSSISSSGGSGIEGKQQQQHDNNSNSGNDIQNSSESPDYPKSPILGFLSFMVTYEDGKEVIYCYEIHFLPKARGRGLGKMLMERMEGIGRLVGVEKAMLTVFKSNEAARRFYDTLGYQVDEYSPRPRRLRNGTVKEVDYIILSKNLR